MRLPDRIKKLMQKFIAAKAEIYVVGGAVRDSLMKRKVKDWDFTTNLTPEEMKKLFPKNSFYNNQFGTLSVVEGKNIYEITTYRTEQGYSDARHPDQVSWGLSLEEDLMRRDFTVNAMAADIDGKVVDPYKGQEDLEKRLIRAVGKAEERFEEDALRMMRAIRIACQIGFVIEELTFEAIEKNCQKISKVSAERVRDELLKILGSPAPAEGMVWLKNSGLLLQILPEVLTGVEVAQKGHHVYDVWNHNLNTLKNCQSEDPITRLACMLHDVAKPEVMVGEGEARTFHNHEIVGARRAVAIGKRLRLSKKQLDQLYKLVRWHMFSSSDIITDKAVRRFIKRVGVELLDEMIALRRADRLGSGAKETSWRWELFKKRVVEVQKQPFSVKDLKVNGEDVMRILKIRPSRKVGEVLEALFAEVEENPKLNKRPVLLKKIRARTVPMDN